MKMRKRRAKPRKIGKRKGRKVKQRKHEEKFIKTGIKGLDALLEEGILNSR